MQKVVGINLNGNAYQLEEPGYEALRSYLQRADGRLQANPDRAEIMADLEQAIAEKCWAIPGGQQERRLAEPRSETISAEMGPVESPMGGAASSADAGFGAAAAGGAGSGPAQAGSGDSAGASRREFRGRRTRRPARHPPPSPPDPRRRDDLRRAATVSPHSSTSTSPSCASCS